MKAAVFKQKGSVVCEERAKPEIQQSTDAILRVVRACVCGSDLWYYRGESPFEPNKKIGHEMIGVIESVGNDVHDFAPGDFVIIPFRFSDNTCPHCLHGNTGGCPNGGYFDGCQAEYVRVPLVDGTAVKVETETYSDELLASLTALSDVMGTGYHAARLANVTPGMTVAVVGDGAVGLCGVIGAKLLGASRIIALSHHEDRAALALEFGATDIVSERDTAATAKIMELTENVGVDAVLECVGTGDAVTLAFSIARPLSMIGSVGVPHNVTLDPAHMFDVNVGFHSGRAPARAYLPMLLEAVLSGTINPGKVFTLTTDLDHISDAYAAMDERRTIKALLRVSEV